MRTQAEINYRIFKMRFYGGWASLILGTGIEAYLYVHKISLPVKKLAAGLTTPPVGWVFIGVGVLLVVGETLIRWRQGKA